MFGLCSFVHTGARPPSISQPGHTKGPRRARRRHWCVVLQRGLCFWRQPLTLSLALRQYVGQLLGYVCIESLLALPLVPYGLQHDGSVGGLEAVRIAAAELDEWGHPGVGQRSVLKGAKHRRP
eukprot:1832139-Prymnesium_polylepis.2